MSNRAAFNKAHTLTKEQMDAYIQTHGLPIETHPQRHLHVRNHMWARLSDTEKAEWSEKATEASTTQQERNEWECAFKSIKSQSLQSTELAGGDADAVRKLERRYISGLQQLLEDWKPHALGIFAFVLPSAATFNNNGRNVVEIVHGYGEQFFEHLHKYHQTPTERMLQMHSDVLFSAAQADEPASAFTGNLVRSGEVKSSISNLFKRADFRSTDWRLVRDDKVQFDGWPAALPAANSIDSLGALTDAQMVTLHKARRTLKLRRTADHAPSRSEQPAAAAGGPGGSEQPPAAAGGSSAAHATEATTTGGEESSAPPLPLILDSSAALGGSDNDWVKATESASMQESDGSDEGVPPSLYTLQ
jgi:hypothetical protein